MSNAADGHAPSWAWVSPPEWSTDVVVGDLVPGKSGRIPSIAPAFKFPEGEELYLKISKLNRKSIETVDYIGAPHHPIISERLFRILEKNCNLGAAQFVPVNVIYKDLIIRGFGLLAVFNMEYVIDMNRSTVTKSFSEGNRTAIFGFDNLKFYEKKFKFDFFRDDRLIYLLIVSEAAKAILEVSCNSKLFFLRDCDVPRRK